MNFTDYLFVPAFLLFSLLYYLTPMAKRWILLLVVSILFYCSWGIEMLPFVIGAAGVAWCAAITMEAAFSKVDAQNRELNPSDKKAAIQKVKQRNRIVLWVAVCCITALLVISKAQGILSRFGWSRWVVEAACRVRDWLGNMLSEIPVLKYMVRSTLKANTFTLLGISYYTMSLIGYCADVYWRKEHAERNFARLLLFTLYFPKILQGPIVKHRELAPDLRSGHKFDYREYCFGWQRILWGYFKKLVLADRLSLAVTAVYSNVTDRAGSELVAAAVLGAIQLYCDFSGCMDIAIGASQTLGIPLAENFNHPFTAKTAAEFWRRWHITLGVWFKDYVYMPLAISPRLLKISSSARKRCGMRWGKSIMTVVPLIGVWILTGLWHGTGWNYLLWGLYWGALISLSSVLEPEMKKLRTALRINPERREFQVFQMVRTFCLFTVGRILTLSGSFRGILSVFNRILRRFGAWKMLTGEVGSTFGLEASGWAVLAAGFLVLCWVSEREQRGISIRDEVSKLPLVLRWALWIGGVMVVLIFGVYGPGYEASGFVYMAY